MLVEGNSADLDTIAASSRVVPFSLHKLYSIQVLEVEHDDQCACLSRKQDDTS